MEDSDYIYFYDRQDNEIVIEKTKYQVCSRCHGKGHHVNPNVDGHGISPQEFAEDPEFRENYIKGKYDVKCYQCGGLRVEKVIDWNKIDDAKLKEEYEIYLCEKRKCDAEIELGKKIWSVK